MLLPHASPPGSGTEVTVSAAADVAIGRLTRAGLRFDQFAFTERRVRVVRVDGVDGVLVDTSVTPAQARAVSAFVETASLPVADARFHLWGGPTLVRYTGDEIRGSQPGPYPARWSVGLSGGLGARHPLRHGISLLADASVNVLGGVGEAVDTHSSIFSAVGLRIGITVEP